ncbi:MAG: hypothetical protein M3Y49_21300 [Actinomycetota bacterium]|nr:hypothetical protein [Actinomycetota bacterium]
MRDHGAEDELPSGRQFQLTRGPWRATVVEVGAGLRMLSVDGREVLDGYSRHVGCTGARGLPLITSLDRSPVRTVGTAGTDEVHLPRSQRWICREQSDHHVLLGVDVRSTRNGADCLDVSVEYQLSRGGLTVCTTAVNTGIQTCSYAAAHQPYLKFGSRIDACHLRIAADRYISTDPHSAALTTQASCGSEFDFSSAAAIGRQNLEVAFTGFHRDADGRAWLWLTDRCGATTALWVDQSYPFIEVYTSHTQAPPHFRTSLGVKPATCAPGARRSGEGLLMLAPGQSTSSTWGITAPPS